MSSTTATIAGTSDGTLYKTERYGNFSYDIPVPNGSYTVTLLFAEIYWTSAGKRVFNVSVEGQPAIQGLDIYATVGANTALVGVLQSGSGAVPQFVTAFTLSPLTEVRDVTAVEIYEKRDVSVTLLFDHDANLQERVFKEQFMT